MKKHIRTLAYGMCLTAFTVFLSLDTFVLSGAYQENATEMNMAMFASVNAEALSESAEETEETSDDVETGRVSSKQKRVQSHRAQGSATG